MQPDRRAAVIPQEHRARHEALYKKVTPYRPLNGKRGEQAVHDCRKFEAEIADQRILLRARRAVIISTGNYTYNLEFLGRYRPEFKECYKEIVRMGTMGDDGSGVELGLSVGGHLAYMDAAVLSRPTYPPIAFVTGATVNLRGERYMKEDATYAILGQAVSEQEDYAAWLILDSRTFWKGFREMLPPSQMFSLYGTPAFLNILFGGTRKAKTLEALARKCGMHADHCLVKTIAAYNQSATTGHDPLGKRKENLGIVGKGPYYAVNMSLRNKWSMSSGMPYGGLEVDEETGAIISEDGTPVPGLFGAGRCTVGMSSKITFSGLSLGDTVFRDAAPQKRHSPADCLTSVGNLLSLLAWVSHGYTIFGNSQSRRAVMRDRPETRIPSEPTQICLTQPAQRLLFATADDRCEKPGLATNWLRRASQLRSPAVPPRTHRYRTRCATPVVAEYSG